MSGPSGTKSSNASFGFAAVCLQIVSQARQEFKTVTGSILFWILLGISLVIIVRLGVNMQARGLSGTLALPTTSMLTNLFTGWVVLPVMTAVTYFSGALLTGKKSLGDAETMIMAKFIALAAMVYVMLFAAIVACVTIQISYGWFLFEPGVYLMRVMVISALEMLLACALAIFIQTLVKRKYIGMAIVAVLFATLYLVELSGFGHYLYLFRLPNVPYTDVNGYGHYLTPFFWFSLYWGGVSVLMLIAASLLWRRGRGESIPRRLRTLKTATIVSTLLVVVVGGFIFYNTNLLNDYETPHDALGRMVLFEKRYGQYSNQVQPLVTDVKVNVDLYPDERRMQAKGTYSFINDSDLSLEELHFSTHRLLNKAELQNVRIDNGRLIHEDNELGYFKAALQPALAPGATMSMEFELSVANEGFANGGSNTSIVRNGTGIGNVQFMPAIGYLRYVELLDETMRREYGLSPEGAGWDLDDEESREITYPDGARDRINLEVVVGTGGDQVAGTSGVLVDKWRENGRNYFHYKTEVPIWDTWGIFSGDYQIARDKWNDVDIEVYYHHDYNVNAMIRVIKDGLDYYSENFSPYQYRQFRVFEMPAYGGPAAAYPNVLTYPENAGFTADLRDKSKIDLLSYVTGHELGHQWWYHQVAPAGMTQGGLFMTDTLAQYSTFMVMEHTYGKDYIRYLLRGELERYLDGRSSTKTFRELPLMRTTFLAHVHYNKGSLVFHTLKEAIGEDRVNAALRNLIADYGLKAAPYPTARDLVTYLRAEAGPRHQALITDLFEKVILYDLRTTAANATALDDGRYLVNLTADIRKFEDDGYGEETELAITDQSDRFDFAVLGQDKAPIKLPEILSIKSVSTSQNTIAVELIVDEKPVMAGIDPYFKKIDREPDDNVIRVKFN